MLENFDCETTANCQNDYARTKGDATGDNKTCGNDYVEILKSFNNQYQDNRVKF